VESEEFHSWQLSQLKQGGVDFLIAETLPSVEEAIGIARAMEYTRLPYIISFVIDRYGFVLDSTSLSDALLQIDSATSRNPVGYMVNCSYPTFLVAEQQPVALFSRLIGFQANASSLDHCDLDNSENLEAEKVSKWSDTMLALNRNYGISVLALCHYHIDGVLGGCCGTGVEHLRYIANH